MSECYIESEDQLIDGIEGANAIRRANGRIEIWDDEFSSHIGFMPKDSSAAVINAALRLYKAGFDHGERAGRRNMQWDIRKTLGLEG